MFKLNLNQLRLPVFTERVKYINLKPEHLKPGLKFSNSLKSIKTQYTEKQVIVVRERSSPVVLLH